MVNIVIVIYITMILLSMVVIRFLNFMALPIKRLNVKLSRYK